MKRKKEPDPTTAVDTQALLQGFETLFEKDKRDAEERLAIIRARIATLERAVAKEAKWIANN